jgi:tellurite resistance protein
MNFFSEINVETHHAEAIARGLFAIAHSDGLHEREAALVGSFWADTGGSMHALASLERGASITGDELATALTTPALRRLFLKTALLMAFADGNVSEQESKLVRTYADALALTSELAALEAEVKDYLLSQLSHIHNTEAVLEIAKKLAI